MPLKLSAVKFVLQLGCFSPLDSTTEVFVLVMVDQFAFVKSWSYAQWRKLSLSKGALFHSFFSDHNLEMWNVFYQKILSQNWPQQQFHMYVCVTLCFNFSFSLLDLMANINSSHSHNNNPLTWYLNIYIKTYFMKESSFLTEWKNGILFLVVWLCINSQAISL